MKKLVKVAMRHPKMKDAEIRVAQSAVPSMMASGWEAVDGKVTAAMKGAVPTDVAPADNAADDKSAAKRTVKES